jgi:hypothetical protein
MAREKMYQKGEPYQNILYVITDIEAGKWIFWKDKPLHPSIIDNMALRVVRMAINTKILCRSLEVKK